ncbi:OmpH family outer membrane protein [Falsirhodobacter sp. alg1]|uniref:OmpH family outer membrane protein n=1 Tax=Falsirhodobacter sp. alg1 TaxID=1472418 RepID=UPI00178CB903|nr:OmpH family outer membrane protein [Falsirhodobacter sp. alg1]
MATAQDAPDEQSRLESAILTVMPDRMFEESMAGKTAERRFEDASQALVAENRVLEADLAAEERALTDKRRTMPSDAFHLEAAAFDKRVEQARRGQDAKSVLITRQRDQDRKAFFQASIPILAELMQSEGALAILDRGSVFLSFDLIDVTDRAIAALDEQLGDGADIFDAEIADTPTTP